MEDYKILIPSYQRANKQTTLELLSSAYGKDDIIISTQTLEDYEAYKKNWGRRATIIYKQGECVGDNRNTLLEYLCQHGIGKGIMLDDDITGFVFYDKTVIKEGHAVRKLLEASMSIAMKAGCTLWGAYPVANAFFMNAKIVKNILIGTCFGILDSRLRFDRQFRIKEDYELCLRVMSGGGLVLRFNGFSPIAAHKSAGGCMNDWKQADNNRYANTLAAAYPELCELNPKRAGEIKFKKQKD